MSNKTLLRGLLAPVVVAVAVLLTMPSSVFGANDYWANPLDGSFNSGGNWTLGHAPAVGDWAFFDKAGTYKVSFPHGPTYQSYIASVFSGDVTFYSADAPNTETYTVTEARPWGGMLTLGRSGSPINLSTSSTLTVQTGGTLNVQFGSHCLGTYLNIGPGSTGTVVVDGLDSQLNATTTGAGNVGSNGGTGNLTYQNSATGNLPGTLLIAADLSGASGHLTIQSGASLTVAALTVGNGSSPAAVTVNGTTSTCLVNGPLIVGAAGVVEISNGGSLAATALSGASASAVVRISDSATTQALVLGGAGTSAYLYYSSIADNTGGPGSLAKVGSNAQWLKGSSTYSGGTTLSGGTLGLGNTSALGAVTSPLTVNGGTLDLYGYSPSVGVLSGSGGTITTTYNVAELTVAFNSISSTYSGTIAGSVRLTKNGTGTLVLAGVNIYNGLTTISAGTLKLGAAGDGTNSPLGVTAAGTAVSSGGALDLNGINLSTAEALSITGTGVNTTGALTNSGGAAIYSGVVTIAGNPASIGGTGDITLSAGLATNANTLTKVGANTLTLNAVSSRTGAVTVSQGTLKVGASGALGTATTSATVSSGAVLDLNGVNYAVASRLTLNGAGISSGGTLTNSSGTQATYSGLLALGSASSIVAGNGNIMLSNAGNITGNTFALTLGGTATGSSLASNINTTTGTVTKNGSGTWTLSGASTYTGATTVNAGTLQITGSALGTTGVTVAADGTLALSKPTASALSTTTTIANDGMLNVTTAGQQVGTIGGLGSISVTGSLTADSIVQSTLTIGAGGSVTIRETTGAAVNAVPEPSTLVLLGVGAIGLLANARRRRKTTA